MNIIGWASGRINDLMGWLGISAYTLRLGLGLAVGLVWWWYSTRSWLSRRQVVLLPAITGFCAIVAGRIGYIAENHLYFQQHPDHITALHTVGGLHGSAALVTATIALILTSIYLKLPIYRVMFCAIPSLLLISAGAWRASIIVGNAIGRQIVNPQGILRIFSADVQDLYGSVETRIVVQHLAALSALLCTALSFLWQNASFNWMLLYTLSCTALAFARGDTVPLWGNLRSDTFMWGAATLLYLLLVIYLKPTDQNNANTKPVTN